MNFKPIEWKSAYSVNIPAIDKQHQKLFDIYNKFGRALAAKESTALVAETLTELIEYTVYHFAEEEKLFAKFNYEHKQAHTQEHNKLKEAVLNFQNKHNESTFKSEQMVIFLRDWLRVHILVTDKAYSQSLTKE